MHHSLRFHRRPQSGFPNATPAGKEEFLQVCTSRDVEPVMKMDVIKTQWTTFCRSKSDVKRVFYGSNILHFVLHDEYYDKSLIAFMCFAIMKSGTIRRQALGVLLSRDFVPDFLPCQDFFMLLASCCLDIVTDGEIENILDCLRRLPEEYLLEKLIILKKLSRSLPFVSLDQAITFRYIMNNIVVKYSTGVIFVTGEQFQRFGATVTSIAKKVSRVLAEHDCFPVQLWRPFLRVFGLEHAITKVCKVPFVIEDLAELPFKLQEALRSSNSDEQKQ